ncbi:MAG: TadE/TadG family type IV pilus assembly protein [Isosphaeraceae bacterium]
MRSIACQKARRSRSGVAAVEMAVCLPMLLTLLVGTWEVGRIVEVQQCLNVAAREAARQAGSGLLTNSQVQQVAVNYVRIALGDSTGTMTQNMVVTVTVYPASNPGTAEAIDVSQCQSLDQIVIGVSIPYGDVRWIALPEITGAGSLDAQATWVSLKDFPFPTTAPQPPTG